MCAASVRGASSRTLSIGPRFQVKLLHVKPGGASVHANASPSLGALDRGAGHGQGHHRRDGASSCARTRASTSLRRSGHRLENPGKVPLELIEVQIGSYPRRRRHHPQRRHLRAGAGRDEVIPTTRSSDPLARAPPLSFASLSREPRHPPTHSVDLDCGGMNKLGLSPPFSQGRGRHGAKFDDRPGETGRTVVHLRKPVSTQPVVKFGPPSGSKVRGRPRRRASQP